MANTEKIEQALRDFTTALPETPSWLVLLRENGELVATLATHPHTQLTPAEVDNAVKRTHSLALAEIANFNALEHGNYQYSIHAGGTGLYIIVNMIDAYVLGVSYQWIGVKSLDAVIDAILIYHQRILDAISL